MDCTPSCRFSSHASIIHSAITREDLPTLQAVMKRVCSNPLNLTDSLGRHAIHVAASCGRVDILEWLVREGKVDVEMRDHESRWTPLHRSLFYGKLTCAVKLLQYGADLYSLDKDDLTPLDSVLLDSPFKLATSVEARVVTNYETKLDDELSLRVNDVITNIQMAGQKYWTGSLKGVRGFFPKDCVKLIKQEYKTDLYTWGVNTNFTLGHQDESLRLNPEIVETLSVEKTLNICQVVMCKFHSVFLSEDGKVLTCGHGRGGRLGHQGEHTQLAPKLVEGLTDHKCVGIAAAQDHTAVVTDSGLVFTFGLNDMHQLGHTPAPTQLFVPKMIQMKLWRGKHMTGVATGQYHTVMYTHNKLFTCGLNIGQLGHLLVKGEKFITTPRQVTALHHKDISIVMVTCSDAATVCATTKGDIFVLSQFTCKKIVSRFPELVRVAVSGGEIGLNINQEPIKAQDKITITMLNARGLVYQWKESYGGIRRCKWSHRKELVVCDIAVGKQLYLITDCGEMFSCTRAGGVHPAVKRVRSSSSVSHGLSFGDGQKDLVNYDVKRCPMVHRGTKVFTDRISKGFAVLQVNPSTGLERFPKVSDSTMCEDFTQLLDETIVEDDIHDVDLVVKGHVIPAHAFILASRSGVFRQLVVENKNQPCGLVNGPTRTLKLDHVDDFNVLEKYIQDLYSGLHVDDDVLFGNKPTKSSSKERQKENPVNGVEDNPISSLLTSFESFSFPDLDDLSVDRPIRNKKQTKKTEKFTRQNGLPTDQKKKMTKDNRIVFKGLKFKRTNCPELHDITIESEDDVQFLCHKCVLIARLDYFRSMLACGWLEASEEMRVLHMPIHSSVLKIVLDYLYTDEARTVQGHDDVVFVGNVLVVADQLLICRLREMCELAMVKLISQKNAVELLEFSCVYNASQLSASCLEFICMNLGCFLEAGYLSLLSQKTLELLSDTYREMIYNMAWRMITPQHDHLFALLPDPLSTPTKKRRTSSRKRSVRSDSEGEGENESTAVQEEIQESENRGRKASESNLDSVFEGDVTENGKEESSTNELPVVAVSIEQHLEKKAADAGAWYRKKAGKEEQIKSPKIQTRPKSQSKTLGKLTVTKPKEIPKPRDEEPLSSRCAWGFSSTSPSSPPSSDLRAIMEQEQLSGATKIKSQTSLNKIEAKGKLSQKQKKKAKLAQHNEANVSPEQQNQQKQQLVETIEEKTNINPWGQLDKKPSCVRSLRELIEQEEKSQSRTRPKPAVNSSPSTAKSNDKGLGTRDKPANTKTRLSWGLPRVGQNEPCQENEAESVSPKSAWQAHASASSPPPSAISFADVIHLQESETTSLNRAKRKPLNLIQLEDRAIQELLEHYGGRDNACETITVERVPSAAATPVWNRARSASAMSS